MLEYCGELILWENHVKCRILAKMNRFAKYYGKRIKNTNFCTLLNDKVFIRIN